MRRFSTLRAQLAVTLTSVLLLSLGVYVVGIYVVLSRHVYGLLDLGLHEEAELLVRRLELGPGGGVHWAGEDAPTFVEEEPGGAHWTEVRSPEGTLLLDASSDPRRPHLGVPFTGANRDPRSFVLPGAFPVRLLTETALVGGRPFLLRVARSEEPVRAHLQRLLLGLGALFPVVVVVFGLLGHLLVGMVLAPFHEMTARAQWITAERLGERLPVGRPESELGQLAAAFNQTLARLESSFEQLRRFTDDASHELRTPLTVMRSVGEVGLSGARSAAEYREIIGSMLEETERLTRMVDVLLTIARTERRSGAHDKTVDLAELVKDVAAQLGILAEERSQQLIVEAARRIEVRGDSALLHQAVVNLVDNAIKYGPVGGTVRLVLKDAVGGACVEVSDEGPGIPEAERERVFERFFRVHGHAQQEAGVGLGLALVKSVAAAHNGRVELQTREGAGSTFRLVIPG